MERQPRPDQPLEKWQIARQAIMEEVHIGLLPMDNLPSLLRNDAYANQITAEVQEKLALRGVDVDSLDLVEAVLDIIDGPSSDNDSDKDGDSGVREPRKPRPGLGGAAVSLLQEPLSEPGDIVADLTDEEIEAGL